MSYNFAEYGFPGYQPPMKPLLLPSGSSSPSYQQAYEQLLARIGGQNTGFQNATQSLYDALQQGRTDWWATEGPKFNASELFNLEDSGLGSEFAARHPDTYTPEEQFAALERALYTQKEPGGVGGQLHANLNEYADPLRAAALTAGLFFGIPAIAGAAGAGGSGALGMAAAPGGFASQAGGYWGGLLGLGSGGAAAAAGGNPGLFGGGAGGTATNAAGLPTGVGGGVLQAGAGNPWNTAANVANAASGVPSWLQNYGSLIGGGLGLVDSLTQPDELTQTTGGTSDALSSFALDPSFVPYAQQGLDRLGALPPYSVAPMGTLFNQAGGALSQTLSGAGINPYLDTVFNAAADSTQNRLASEFAHAGQYGSPQNQQARSQQLQQLAAGIYGPGYEAERQRQFSAIPLGGQFGQIQQGYGQMQADAPFTDLQRYAAGLQGLFPFYPGAQRQQTSQTGNVTQPLFNNPLGGFLGGALLGQSIFGGGF